MTDSDTVRAVRCTMHIGIEYKNAWTTVGGAGQADGIDGNDQVREFLRPCRPAEVRLGARCSWQLTCVTLADGSIGLGEVGSPTSAMHVRVNSEVGQDKWGLRAKLHHELGVQRNLSDALVHCWLPNQIHNSIQRENRCSTPVAASGDNLS